MRKGTNVSDIKQSIIFQWLCANFCRMSRWVANMLNTRLHTWNDEVNEQAFIHFTSPYIYSSCKQPIYMMEHNLSRRHCVLLLYFSCEGACGGFLDGNRASKPTSTPTGWIQWLMGIHILALKLFTSRRTLCMYAFARPTWILEQTRSIAKRRNSRDIPLRGWEGKGGTAG